MATAGTSPILLTPPTTPCSHLSRDEMRDAVNRTNAHTRTALHTGREDGGKGELERQEQIGWLMRAACRGALTDRWLRRAACRGALLAVKLQTARIRT